MKNAGYLFSDDRASGGKLVEADVLSCSHCQKLLIGNDWRSDGGWCGRCGAAVCGKCSDKMLTEGCQPFVKLVDKQLTRQARRRALSALMGV